jgi:hypothetical protein
MSAFTDAFNAISYGGEKGNLQPSAASPMTLVAYSLAAWMAA